MSLNEEQTKSLKNAREMVPILIIWTGIPTGFGAMLLGGGIGIKSYGFIAASVVCFIAAIWLNKLRSEYKRDIEYFLSL